MKRNDADLLILESQIEHMRGELNRLAMQSGMQHPDVLEKSKQLDLLVVEHMKMQIKSRLWEQTTC